MTLIRPKKIFIVDDDPMTAEALTDYLSLKAAHQIRSFSTGEECINNLSERPDIIILDYFLNSVNKDAADGMEILKSIKKIYPEVHVIMLSSQERYAVAMQTIQKGADQYVIKDEDAFAKIANMVAGL